MKHLVAFSNLYGADPELVVAGGGNTSMKENGVLYVKDDSGSRSSPQDVADTSKPLRRIS